jgi:hypothetical protein
MHLVYEMNLLLFVENSPHRELLPLSRSRVVIVITASFDSGRLGLLRRDRVRD